MTSVTSKLEQDSEGFVHILEFEQDEPCLGEADADRASILDESSPTTLDESPQIPGFADDLILRDNQETKPRLLDEKLISQAIQVPLLRNQLLAEEKLLGDWPRRLLHVETSTSYTWQPGNIYGGVCEPLYNAITYTWGRWRLNDDDMPEVRPLPVHSVPWAMPRIDPKHFSPSDLHRVLTSATKEHMMPSASWMEYKPVDFVWLDVACIDQNPQEPTSAAEIGRQAAIFKGAQAVFVWLSTFSSEHLHRICTRLDSTLDSEERKKTDDNLQLAANAFQEIQADPWFTSLWTLQEAFLRSGDALLMSRSGEVVCLTKEIPSENYSYHTPTGRKTGTWPAVTSQSPFDLALLIDNASELCKRGFGKPYVSQNQATSSTLADIARSACLVELATVNPMSVYTAAHRRDTSRPEDRIYGIEQIFGLRLGPSAPVLQTGIVPRHNRSYSILDLQNQLGEQLMLKYPVLSQMYVYTKPQSPGMAWRITEDCVVPGTEEVKAPTGGAAYPQQMTTWVGQDRKATPLCRLDIHIEKDKIWGQFEGKMCAFNKFFANCKLCESNCIMAHAYTDNGAQSFLAIWPDVVEELVSSPEYKGMGYHAIPVVRQRAFATWLSEHFGDKLKVLIVGLDPDYEKEGHIDLPNGQRIGHTLGMLLVRREEKPMAYWRRIGICRWSTRDLVIGGIPDHWKPWFSGEHTDWALTRGIFG